MRYRISCRADADIERICDHVAADNPDAADRLDERLHREIQLLAGPPASVTPGRTCRTRETASGLPETL